MHKPFIYSVVDEFNRVFLPLRNICPFSSFGVLIGLYPLPKSCFVEPLNVVDMNLCSFQVRHLRDFLAVFWMRAAELEYPHVTLWAVLDPECQDGSTSQENSQNEKIKTRSLQVLRKMLP